MNNDIRDLLNYYESIGIPFAKAYITNISIYDDFGQPKLRIDVQINENNKVEISSVKIRGNESTKDYVILRELNISKDNKVTKESLENMKRKLEALNIFETVEDPRIYTVKKTNQTELLIEVKEGNTNTFDGILGYVPPPSPNEKGYLTGLVDLSFRNLFGTGRRLDAKWQQQIKATQELEFKYMEPYIFSLPLSINLGFNQRIQDSTYTKRRIEGKGDLFLGDKFTVSAIGGYERVIPSDDSNRIFIISDYSILFSGLELKYDSRNNIYFPTSGNIFRTTYIYGRKKVFNTKSTQDQSYSMQRITGELELYVSPFKRQSNLLRFGGGQVISGKLEDADFFRIGGLKYIRGYRSEQFLASKLVYSNIEPRYSLARKSFLFAFFDFGYYYRPSDEANNIPKQEGFLYGYGIGMRFETAIGIIGVNYALGKGDSFLDGKISFGYINEF